LERGQAAYGELSEVAFLFEGVSCLDSKEKRGGLKAVRELAASAPKKRKGR